VQSVGLLRGTDEILLQKAVVTRYAYVIYDEHRKASVELIHDYLIMSEEAFPPPPTGERPQDRPRPELPGETAPMPG
jgi:hypothetical protein